MTESTSDSAEYYRAVKQELAALEEDLLWTEKAHFAAAETLARVNFWVGVVATIAASVAAAAVLADATPVVTGVAALIAAIASGLLTFLKPTEAEGHHLDAGRRLGALRVRVRQALRLDLLAELDVEPQELPRTRLRVRYREGRDRHGCTSDVGTNVQHGPEEDRGWAFSTCR